jgi:hypothetical protein
MNVLLFWSIVLLVQALRIAGQNCTFHILKLVYIYTVFEQDEISTVAWLILTRKLIYRELEQF